MQGSIDAVRKSYGRVLTKRTFVSRFYEIFTQSHPVIGKMFKNTDFKRQNELLSQSINMAILFPQNNVIAKNAIARIRQSHNHEHLNINPNLYPLWLDSLIAAVKETDPEFTPALEKQWREILEPAINHIKEGY